MHSTNLLGPLFKRSRIKAGLTQAQVCNRLSEQGIKMDRTTLARVEGQKRKLKDLEMVALVEVLGITLGEVEKAFQEG